MSQPKTCCPVGKTYDTKSGLCLDQNRQNPTDPIECPCCPVGYNYDSPSGLCINLAGNTTSTVPCLCCPDGYTYMSQAIPPQYPNGYCRGQIASDIVPTIPCLNCNCTEDVIAVCAPCVPSGVAVKFAYNFMQQNCTVCAAVDFNPPTGCITSFMPSSFSDPNTTFTLTNLNYI